LRGLATEKHGPSPI